MPRIVTRLWPFLLVVFLASPAHARKEPKTGVNFKGTMTPAGASGPMTLMGVGARIKEVLMVDVNVYAVGLYVSSADGPTALAAWHGKKTAELRKDSAFYDALMSDSVEKSLRLVMARSVDGDTMRDAFDDALKPRTKKYGGSDKLGAFRGYFTMDDLDEGVELLFTWKRGGVLVTSIGGKKKGEIKSEGLCKAFFDIYVGDKPVSSAARNSFYGGLAKLLKP